MEALQISEGIQKQGHIRSNPDGPLRSSGVYDKGAEANSPHPTAGLGKMLISVHG